MNLISEIEALKQNQQFYDAAEGKFYKPAFNEILDKVFNDAIDKVLDILKAEFEEKDQPDEEGWWWLIDDDGRIIDAKFLVNIDGELWTDEGIGYGNFELKRYHGKWVKAITPE